MDNDSLIINSTAQEQILQITTKCAEIKPLVAIHCITYNHEQYLRDALDGFIMQQTDFPFVAIVHDDVSTDKTADILREYAEKHPDIILPIYETENQFSKRNGSLSRIMRTACSATGAKYIAYCEGDDYWNDPLKLQKQVDYLESHPDCSLCFHNVIRHCEDGSQPDQTMFEIDENVKYGGWDILNNCPIQTASIVLRLDILFSKLYARARKNAVIGDYPLFLTAASYGYLHGYHKPMSVYRKHLGGATNQLYSNTSIFYRYMRQLENIPIIFGKEYNSTVKDFVCSRYISNALGYAKKHMWKDVAKCIYRSFSLSISQTIKEIGKYLKFKLK